MRSLLYLACPVGMGVMMWAMMRGQRDTDQQPPAPTPAQQQEIAELRAELNALRDEQPHTADPTR